jgi:hypothetical protein
LKVNWSFPIIWALQNAEESEVTFLRHTIEMPREQKSSKIIQETIQILQRTGTNKPMLGQRME